MELFQFKKNSTLIETVQYYSLLWDQNDDNVKFDTLIDTVEENGCKIVSMTYRKPNPAVDNRCMMVFGVFGTFVNLQLFELSAYQNSKLTQFRDPSDI